MRDYIVLAIVLLSAPLAVLSPYYGVVVWSWIAYFNPHRYGWGIAHDFPVAATIAVPTLVGLIFAPKNHRIFVRETVLLGLLWGWFAFTTYYITMLPVFVSHWGDARSHLEGVSKILLMTFVTILVVSSADKLRVLVLVMMASFGFRALFAAIFFIKTGGQYRIWGPEGTFIEDNNDFALALNMILPMFYFMAKAEPQKWMRIAIRILGLSVVISVIGTYSRGGLLGLAAVSAAIICKSKRKAFGIALLAIGILCVTTYSATQWKDRMGSFAQGTLDESAESRLIVWKAGWNLVKDYPFTGGGFDVYTDMSAFPQYIESAYRYTYGQHGPHSIYFQIMGEQGIVGLGLFLALIVACYASLRSIRRRSMAEPRLAWASLYANMFEVSLLAYCVNGATLGRAYFDFFYQIVACIIILRILHRREVGMLLQPRHSVVDEMEMVAA